MKVLMVTPTYHPIIGGTETAVRNFAIRLNDLGIHADVVTFNMTKKWNPKWKAKEEKIDGVKVYKIPGLNWFPITHSDRWTSRINLIPGRFAYRFKNYDIIHFHDDADLTFPLFSYFVNKPKLLHLHSFYLDYYKRYFIPRYTFKKTVDMYICISKLVENHISKLGIPPDKIRRLPNGIDIDKFNPAGGKINNLVLFTGRINRGKGIHVLLESLQYLDDSISLVLIGPSDWDRIYFHKVLDLIEKENKQGRHEVSYLGSQDQGSVIDWYQKASIFVLPSFHEIYPVSILEALACETPVITTKCGGTTEIIQDYKNGLFVPVNDPVRLAEAIQHLLSNEEIRRKFGEAGRKWVSANASLQTTTKKLVKIYEELISHTSSYGEH